MSKVQITAFTGEYYFLSNYCACPITIDGLTYRSAEAAFQAAKCNAPIDRAAFCTVPPNVAKAIGRKIKLRDGWRMQPSAVCSTASAVFRMCGHSYTLGAKSYAFGPRRLRSFPSRSQRNGSRR